MRLEKEFVVGAPLERVWPAMSDAGVIAASLPGAELRRADDVYTGRLELSANGTPIACEATLRAVDRDEDQHVATVLVHARQLGGPGIGSATLRSSCEPADSSTRVSLTAELRSSGHEQRPEAVRDVAQQVFERAAEMLEQRALAAPEAAPAPEPGPAAAPAADQRPPISAAPSPPAAVPAAATDRRRRLAVAGGALVVVVLARRRLARRRTGPW
jgi:carbon monoxide dehydrogenase subunit G